MGGMVMEAAIGICLGKTVCGLVEGKPLICKLLLQLCDLAHLVNHLGPGSMMVDNFHAKGIITLLSHGPVDAFQVSLVVCKEELLTAIKSRAGEFVSTRIEVLGMDRAAMAMGTQQLWTGCVPVNHDKGGDLVVAIVRGDLEDVMDGMFLEVGPPAWTRVDVWLRTHG